MNGLAIDTPRRFLTPCTIFASKEEHLISTLLGSCVAVCLWDPVKQQGGMNHYMLPLWNGDGLPTPKFGNVAIDQLIQRMQNLGSSKERLIAKVFGGANVLATGPGHVQIGERNAMLAQELLGKHGIPIKAQDVGGPFGRKIIFNTQTGVVMVGKLSKSAEELPNGRPRGVPAP